jgi:cobalt-zinc-cadmium efflux system protein
MNNISYEQNIMGHGHHHHHTHGGDPRGALMWALALNGGFFFIELGIGLWSNSLALLSDAAHMASDVGALTLALGAAQLARRPALEHQTFGLKRAEVLGGFVNALFMLLAVAWIVWEAVDRLRFAPPDVPGIPILVAGVIGLAINLGSAWFLYRSSAHNDLNVRGALVHMLGDALGSVGAIGAAIFVLFGFPAADALISLGIAGLVLWVTVGLLKDSGRILFQLPPVGLSVQELQSVLGETEGVLGVHDVHVWTLDGNEPIVTAHLVTESDMDVVRCLASKRLQEILGVDHATLQVEHQDVCHNGPCHLTQRREDGHDHHTH